MKSVCSKKKKLVRITTVPLSLAVFCKGLLAELSADYDVLAVSSPGKELDEVGRDEGIRTVSVPMERRMSPLGDLVSLVRLARLFRRERPDAVHSMTPKAGLLAMMAAWMARVPVRVHTFTGLVFPSAHGLKKRLLMLTDRMTCLCATHVLSEGEGVRRDLLSNNITRKPLPVLGHGNVRGVDLARYDRSEPVMEAARRIRESLGIGVGAFIFVYVGRLVHDKGIKELVSAFCGLRVRHPEACLLLVGGTEDCDPVDESTLAKMTAANHIYATAWQRDVRPWYAVGDVFVFPSHREGFPNVVIEACAMGLPCIVTDINGSREIIENGVNGLVVPPRDVERLREAMSHVVERRDEFHAMAARARCSVASRFEQGYVRQCLKDFYRAII